MAVEGLPTSSVRNFQAEQPKQAQPITLPRGFFIFIFFYFRFLQKYISDLEIYRNIPRQLGGKGLSEKKRRKKIFRQVPGAGRPAAGRPAPQAAQQRGGRPWPPGCRATGSPAFI